MFKRITSYPGFWKSALFLSFMYLLILLIVQWFSSGFSSQFLDILLASDRIWVVPIAGFIAGFMVSYGKFYSRIKREDLRK